MKSTKKFVYLIQGKKDNLYKYCFLQNESSDLFTLTYDSEFNESISWEANFFLPNSTWAEGRNFQLDKVLNLERDYMYYIFLDDDAVVTKGSFEDFQNLLLKYKPAVGLPLCDIVKNNFYYLLTKEVQHAVTMDQIVQAYHHTVVKNKFVLPFVTKFDGLSWWYSCQINTYMIFSNYLGSVIQFNSIEVRNMNHLWDENTFTSNDKSSIYKGGITDEGILEVKNYLDKILTRKLYLYNTLYSPINRSRVVPLPSSLDILVGFFLLFKETNFKQLIRLVYSNLINLPFIIYVSLFYGKYLINPYKFKGIDEL